MVVYTQEHVYRHPWDRVTAAAWRKFTDPGLIEVEERSTYRPHPERPEEWTQFRQETTIRCRPLSALAAVAEKVETRCAERFLQNSAKGREVVERICRYLEAEAAGAASSAI
uniref:PRELI/MSF1 domain-containing protein n=1 Tax=Oryza barthii TaxID=65489 RepID=A0A0D3F9R1_9ORYZ